MFGGYAFQTAGLLYTTPAKSGFVTGSSVVLVPLLLAIFWRKHLARWAYGGAFCAVIGLYFLTVPAEGLARLNHGDVLTFAAAGLYAVHIILVGDYTQRHSHGALSVLQVAACAALAWIATGSLAAIGWEALRRQQGTLHRHRHLRRLRHRSRVLHPTLGAAVHHAESRCHHLHARAGLRRDHLLSRDPRTPQRPLHPRRVLRPRRHPHRRTPRRPRRPRIPRTRLRGPHLFRNVVAPLTSFYRPVCYRRANRLAAPAASGHATLDGNFVHALTTSALYPRSLPRSRG
jgi:hypothetical protein